jgi:hypothetical protein
MLPQSYSTKPSRRTRRVPAPRLAITASQPVDGLERSVLLNGGEEDLGWRILHLRSDGDDASADIEPADLVDGRNRPARVGWGSASSSAAAARRPDRYPSSETKPGDRAVWSSATTLSEVSHRNGTTWETTTPSPAVPRARLAPARPSRPKEIILVEDRDVRGVKNQIHRRSEMKRCANSCRDAEWRCWLPHAAPLDTLR